MKKCKQLFCLAVLVCTVLALCLCANAETYSGTCGASDADSVSWSLDTATGTLAISGTGAMINGTSIKDVPWYSYRGDITTVTIGDGVTSICTWAFDGCKSLATITIPNSVTSIGNFAFSGCTSLTSITIPGSVTSIGNQAFWNCSLLTSVTIPSGVTRIGVQAFYSCASLTSVEIPDSVTSIGTQAFCDCASLEQIVVSADNTAYASDEYGVLFNKDKTTLMQYPVGNSRSTYSIPNSVTGIGTYAFSDCASLEQIVVGADNTAYASDEYGVLFNKDKTTSVSGRKFSICL